MRSSTLPSLGQRPAGGLQREHADQPDRDDRDAGLERHAGDAGLAAVEPAVGAAGALRVEAEQLAALQDAEAGAQRRLAGRAAGAVDRDHADAGEEAACCSSPLNPPPVK